MSNNIKFYPKPSESALTKIQDLYYAIDALIVTCPDELNPMTKDGYNFWDWGILEVNGVKIPAPYKDYGVTFSGDELPLSDRMSAITNTLIWLDRLRDLADADYSINPLVDMNLKPGYKKIHTWGENKTFKILRTLREACYDDVNAYRVID